MLNFIPLLRKASLLGLMLCGLAGALTATVSTVPKVAMVLAVVCVVFMIYYSVSSKEAYSHFREENGLAGRVECLNEAFEHSLYAIAWTMAVTYFLGWFSAYVLLNSAYEGNLFYLALCYFLAITCYALSWHIFKKIHDSGEEWYKLVPRRY